MAEQPDHLSAVDINAIEDPNVRKALRAIHEEFATAIGVHQVEMRAILETLLNKNITSIAEFRRQVQKIQQGLGRNRVNQAIASATEQQKQGN